MQAITWGRIGRAFSSWPAPVPVQEETVGRVGWHASTGDGVVLVAERIALHSRQHSCSAQKPQQTFFFFLKRKLTSLELPGISSLGFFRGPMACRAVLFASCCRISSISARCICELNNKWLLRKGGNMIFWLTSLALALSFTCSGSSLLLRDLAARSNSSRSISSCRFRSSRSNSSRNLSCPFTSCVTS